MEITFKKCGECEEVKPLSQFRKTGRKFTQDILRKQGYLSKCKKCEFVAREGKKFEQKANDSISHHAEVLGVKAPDLHKWGITAKWVELLFLREWVLYQQGFHACVNCFGYGKTKKEGCLDEITLDNKGNKTKALTRGDFHFDVIDKERMRRRGFLTRSNCRVICKTANIKKGSKDPTDYDLELAEEYNDKEALKKGIQDTMVIVSPQPRLSDGQLSFIK